RNILPFKSYREVPPLAAEAGSPLTSIVAVDKNSFSWAMAEMLTGRMKGLSFDAGDDVLARARAVKTPMERERMRECGRIHARIMDELLPARMRPGMSEEEIARIYAEECLRNGSDSLCRMNAHGEEMFYGYASCADSGLYPTAYNGPLGCRGLHPATPFLGSRDIVWQKEQLVSVDMGCQKAGYHTDRTQCYWSGRRASLPAALDRAHKACAEILMQALDSLRPGATPAGLWKNAQETASRLGLREGFMGLGPDQVPFLGHGIGLALDEWPALARAFNEPLEAGMAIALEPKISLPGLGMTGIEHTYLVGENGPEPLTGTRTDILFIE
ncbi:MAG: M24 family metallopeptidase, partial [Desulfovibrionaceae bacterium]|nr:M24 family metallopeptidase [Desulfovibrionaceae bacterium]